VSKKTSSITLISLIYAIGAIFSYMMFDLTLFNDYIYNLLFADVMYTLFIFIWSLIFKNASLYDPYWSVIPPLFLIFTLFKYPEFISFSNIMMILAILIWSIRLTLNWAKHWIDFNHMDWRYENFKTKYPKLYVFINLFGIQLMPTLIVFLQIVVGVRFMFLNENLSIISVLGLLLIFSAVCIQYVADKQMFTFRQMHKGRKALIDTGLWKYSRHPNYLGEIMVWTGLYVMYVGSKQQIDLYVLAPIVMFLLFYFISIPLMENKILKSRPQYKIHQQHISKLWLWPSTLDESKQLTNQKNDI